MASKLIENTMRLDNLPHIWCPGCGNGILMRDVAQAIENLGLDHDKVVIVSGIGCSSRAAGYMNFNTIHTAHGRAIAYATGIKMAKPELEVIVVTGDGDCTAIGGNHLIHACRRNIGITVVCFNNNIYGMTGGQYSPTTPTGDKATTAPYGNIDRTFDLVKLAEGAGATYVARGDAFHAPQTTKLIQDGIAHKGFSFIEGVAVCPTYYGRKNRKGDAVKMMMNQKENYLMKAQYDKLSDEEKVGKLCLGVFHKEEGVPEYTEKYLDLIARVRKD